MSRLTRRSSSWLSRQNYDALDPAARQCQPGYRSASISLATPRKSSCVPAAIIGARTCNRHHFAKEEECVTATGREERQLCCWLPRYVMACRYFDAEANLVTIHGEASKCRQSALNHRVTL